MGQICFSVSGEAEAYLKWYARNILFEKTEALAARHLMMHRLEEIRRERHPNDPAPEDLAVPESTDEKKDQEG